MRCSTRLLLITAFAIFAGLSLLAASTRTVAREVAPRSPAAQISSSEDNNDEAWDWPSLLSSAPPSSPTPCPSALAADAAAGLVAERRAAFPAGCPNASSALYASLRRDLRWLGEVRVDAPSLLRTLLHRTVRPGKAAALLLNRTGTYVVARADFWEDQHARRCVRGLRETFADAFGGFAARARAPLVLVFNFESNARETRKSFPTLSYCKRLPRGGAAPAADAANDILFPRYYFDENAKWSEARGSPFRLDGLPPHPWAKKAAAAVFRGTATDVSRVALAALSDRWNASGGALALDAAVTGYTSSVAQAWRRLGGLSAFGGMPAHRKKLSMPAQVSGYKYIVNVEGAGWACADRLPALLTSDSVVLKQASRNVEWWYALLQPWVHYVPVDAHWADLRERLDCLRKRDALAARVAAEGRRLAQALSTDAALCFAWNVLQRASRLAPPEKWEALAKEVQRIAEGGENGLEMRPL